MIEWDALYKVTLGLYVLGANEASRPVGSIVDAVMIAANKPCALALSCGNASYTKSCIEQNHKFSLSVLPKDIEPFVVANFGFQSSKNINKWDNVKYDLLNGLPVLQNALAQITAKVLTSYPLESNTVFIAAGSNFSNKLTSNIGSLHNQGVELALTWRAIQMKDWSWELGYNVTWNSNEIDELVASQGDDYVVQYGGSAVGAGSSDGIKGWTVGQPSTAYYTYQQVYDENGQPIEGEFVDRDGNGVINGDDRYFYKKADPDVLMGLTSKLIYKNWDLSFSLRASLGNYNYNAVECSNSNLSSSSTYSGSTWHNVLDMARPKNWQQVSSTDALSDYFIQNASYLKCDNITLGYSFDKIGALALGGRIYFTAQNVFTVTKYKGLDPEVNGGYDSNIYPRPFMGILGVSLNF